ncbi:MAG: IS200/IS605 family transposase [Candidatus Saccharimonadales bacterium]|jgi:putative transposase
MPTLYRHKSHCVFLCDYHIVFPTKYRRSIINEGVKAFITSRIKEIQDHYPEVIFKTANTDKDHIHMLVSIPPTWSVGKVVGIIKANTARGMKAELPFLKKIYWGTDSIWSEGYFVSTVGINESTIRSYIENQGKQDSGQTNLRLV